MLLLIVLLASTSAWLVSQFVVHQLADHTALLSPPVSTPVHPQPDSLQGAFGLRANLWGASVNTPSSTVSLAQTAQNNANKQQAEAQIRQLNLQLTGLVITPVYRLAIIRTRRDELTLLEGEQVSPDVLLQQVLVDHVVLVSRGQTFRLWLDDGRLDGTADDALDPLLAQQLDNEARIQEVAQSLRLKPLSIGNYVQFRTLFKNGRWDGVAIAPKDDPEVYRYLGFETNDIIRAVNGHSTNEIAQSDHLWRRFLTEERFEVSVERNGQLETISIDLSQ
ncbi:type II secretion system protein N [Thiomicrospira microaerophila]|uniref:type II secretion system protein N n=1 Tax=Thiomicrospira microaerophila TaxID=406020 RepID=UPI0012FDEC24|nr:type II secretion system protein N [Thiomicrospira microaerophila]